MSYITSVCMLQYIIMALNNTAILLSIVQINICNYSTNSTIVIVQIHCVHVLLDIHYYYYNYMAYIAIAVSITYIMYYYT